MASCTIVHRDASAGALRPEGARNEQGAASGV